MKKVITVLILLLTISTTLFSSEKRNGRHPWDDLINRSISATVDKNTLSICSDKQCENLDIQIQDINGTVVYANKVSLQAGVEFLISVSDLLGETCQIVLIVNGHKLDIMPVG